MILRLKFRLWLSRLLLQWSQALDEANRREIPPPDMPLFRERTTEEQRYRKAGE